MKKLLIALLGISFGAALFALPPPPPPPPHHPQVPPHVGPTTPHGGFDHFEAARNEARRLRRPMLVLFTGSDWCRYCMQLKSHILDSREFRHFARERLILVYIDVPRDVKLPRKLRHQNQALLQQYGVSSYPTTVILSPHGRELGKIVGGPPDYIRRVMHYAK